MTDYSEIAQHFARDFAEATLKTQREDGLFRHIEFSAPKSMSRLIVVTWPYNLLVAAATARTTSSASARTPRTCSSGCEAAG
ncbi:hypothetical protein ACFQ51_52330 [Streptomyces kaempferi]